MCSTVSPKFFNSVLYIVFWRGNLKGVLFKLKDKDIRPKRAHGTRVDIFGKCF